MALTTDPARVPALRAAGVVPLVGDLDRPLTVARLAGLADRVIHLAPPPREGEGDPRTLALVRALRRRELVIVYHALYARRRLGTVAIQDQ